MTNPIENPAPLYVLLYTEDPATAPLLGRIQADGPYTREAAHDVLDEAARLQEEEGYKPGLRATLVPVSSPTVSFAHKTCESCQTRRPWV